MVLGFIPHLLLVLTYLWHGVSGLSLGEEYLSTIEVSGFNSMINDMILTIVDY